MELGRVLELCGWMPGGERGKRRFVKVAIKI